MKILIIILSPLLTWTAFDRNLFRRRHEVSNLGIIEISAELNLSELQQKKKIQKRLSTIIPKSYRLTKKPVRSKCSYVSVKSKDARDSDQRKIRRRFNNM
jgi:hypothetical protein